MKKTILIFIILISYSFFIYSEKFSFKYSASDKYQLTIRGNIKVYLNNKYQGLNVREVKGILDVENSSITEMKIRGRIYHYKKVSRDNRSLGNEIDETESSAFILSNSGIITSSTNPIFPPLNGVPYFPDKNINIGDIFENKGTACVSLYNLNENLLINIISKNRYSGRKEYLGNLYDYFEISYDYLDIKDPKNILKARGRHNLSLFFENGNGKPVFMKDMFSEEFETASGDKIKQEGFYLYFYKLILPMNKDKMIVELKKDIDQNILKDFDVVKKKEGISITLNNKSLKFKPDSKELLDSEKSKLFELASALKKIPDRSFMIIGHTALYGTKNEQMTLSVERAKTIAEFLIQNGIQESRIFFTGKGATDPVAPNDSEENMQKNRRVEIIIQED